MRRSVGLVMALAGAAALLHAACGGKVVIDESYSGGSGGASSGSQSSASSAIVSTTIVTTTTGPNTVSATAVSTGTGPCVSCGEFLTNGSTGVLCPESEKLYDALVKCACAKSCIPQCGDNACVGEEGTDECFQCVSTSCQDAFSACANDV
jgi:hypothetical protein